MKLMTSSNFSQYSSTSTVWERMGKKANWAFI